MAVQGQAFFSSPGKGTTMEEMNAVFLNEEGREYAVNLTVPIMYEFCRTNNIKLEGINPLLMNISQLIDVAYVGSRSSKLVTLGETQADFIAGLDGESFSDAQEAATSALINFSLRTLPKAEAKVLEKELGRLAEIQKQIDAAREAQDKVESNEKNENGPGEMSTESAGQPENPLTEQEEACGS